MSEGVSLGVIPAGSTILRRAEMSESLDDIHAGNPMRMLLVSMPDGACYWVRVDGSRELAKPKENDRP